MATVTAPILLDSTGQQIKAALEEVSILPQIVDNLTTSDATKALSAKQGKVLNDRFGIFEDSVMYSPSSSWKYLGLSVTIPANCAFVINARGGYNYSLCKQIAITVSSTTMNQQEGAISIDGTQLNFRPWVTFSSIAYSDPLTYYVWGKCNETMSGTTETVILRGFYIKL